MSILVDITMTPFNNCAVTYTMILLLLLRIRNNEDDVKPIFAMSNIP